MMNENDQSGKACQTQGVTVCIPVYNGARFLPRLLDSLLAQSFGEWTAIVVDDASTDDSCDVVSGYAARDARIHLERSKVNSGSANVPILRAVSMAATEWVCVCGQDDWVEPDYLRLLVERAAATGVDAVVATMVMVDDKGGELSRLPDSDFDMQQVLSGRDACALTIGRWQIGANGMLCRRRLQLAVMGESGTEMNRDEVNTRKVLALADKVAFAPAAYNYLIHQGSITRKVTPKLFDKLETNEALLVFLEDTYPDDLALQAQQWDAAALDVKGAHYLYWRHADSFASLPDIADRLRRAFLLLAWRNTRGKHASLRWLYTLGSYRLYKFVLSIKYGIKKRREKHS